MFEPSKGSDPCATTVGGTKLGDQQCIGLPQLLGRSFQKARNFTASIVTPVTLDQSVLDMLVIARIYTSYGAH